MREYLPISSNLINLQDPIFLANHMRITKLITVVPNNVHIAFQTKNMLFQCSTGMAFQSI